MAKTFGGFTEQQKEVLARKMGFNGPMNQFGNFLQSSPAHQQKFLSYEDKAKQVISGNPAPQPKPSPAFADGGAVDRKPTDQLVGATLTSSGTEDKNKTTSTATTTAPIMDTNSAGSKLTNTAIKDPEKLITPVEVDPLKVNPGQIINKGVGQITKGNNVVASTVDPTAIATASPQTAAPQVTTTNTVPGVQAATEGFQAAQGTVSANSQVEAATALPSADATVQGQLDKLMQQFEGGKTPAWAAGALRNANAMMAQRGLGASSIAGAATTQAAMESAIQIAVADASTFSQFEMANLNNRQQARLMNAQSFLQMDLANLDAEQQMTMFKSQSIVQSLFTDAAADNATKQFNATNQAQTDQFFANLKTQTSQFNASQKNAMAQFKAGQKDSVAMFNKEQRNAVQQFNATNRLIIDQSNAEWRRAVSTANNASKNEANRVNAQAATGMTLAGYNNLMQKERDFYSFAYQSSENAAQRASDLAIAQFNANASSKAAKGEAVGALAGVVFDNLAKKWFA